MGHRTRRRRGRAWQAGVLVAVGLIGAVALFLDGRQSGATGGMPHPPGAASIAAPPGRASGHTPGRAAKPGPDPASESAGTGVPATGSGTFVAAHATGAKVGSGGHVLRYAVLVETGIGIAPDRAAQEIEGILGAPRGWTTNGAASFQLVGEGQPHDLTVRIATPGTADALCWAGIHQDTEGEYNCEVPGGVVVNLKRWVEGSPTFDGPIHDYRALIVNHEMGHFLGYGHMECPGSGRLAPVMMQQIKGLHGCVANAWPYDTSGRFILGPRAR